MRMNTWTKKLPKYIIQQMIHFAKYLALLFIAVATIATAQSFDPIGTGVINQQVSTVVNPENPREGQDVTISLTAYGTNLNAANISWTINGSRVEGGVGVTQITFNVGKIGETKRVVATIFPQSGPTITKSFTVSAQEVAIIYESDGYVPPFYKGKGVYAREGTVTLVAVPNLISKGVKLNPNTLTYKWIVDGTVQGSKSGYGRTSFVYTGSILGEDSIIEVEASSVSGNVKGRGLILLSPLSPEVRLYERNPLYGVLLNKELTTNGFSLKDTEATISAIPYSTSAAKLSDGTLSYVWTINNSTIPVPASQSFATFRNSTGQTGTSIVGVTVNNTAHLLQTMKTTLDINF